MDYKQSDQSKCNELYKSLLRTMVFATKSKDNKNDITLDFARRLEETINCDYIRDLSNVRTIMRNCSHAKLPYKTLIDNYEVIRQSLLSAYLSDIGKFVFIDPYKK